MSDNDLCTTSIYKMSLFGENSFTNVERVLFTNIDNTEESKIGNIILDLPIIFNKFYEKGLESQKAEVTLTYSSDPIRQEDSFIMDGIVFEKDKVSFGGLLMKIDSEILLENNKIRIIINPLM